RTASTVDVEAHRHSDLQVVAADFGRQRIERRGARDHFCRFLVEELTAARMLERDGRWAAVASDDDADRRGADAAAPPRQRRIALHRFQPAAQTREIAGEGAARGVALDAGTAAATDSRTAAAAA